MTGFVMDFLDTRTHFDIELLLMVDSMRFEVAFSGFLVGRFTYGFSLFVSIGTSVFVVVAVAARTANLGVDLE